MVTKLISNQPISSEISDIFALLTKGATTDEKAIKFKTASSLSGGNFKKFISNLDFSDMNSESRTALQNAIITNVSQMLGDHADPIVSQLRTRIRDLMLPGAEQEFITSTTVLSWFGISSQSALFPAPTDKFHSTCTSYRTSG